MRLVGTDRGRWCARVERLLDRPVGVRPDGQRRQPLRRRPGGRRSVLGIRVLLDEHPRPTSSLPDRAPPASDPAAHRAAHRGASVFERGVAVIGLGYIGLPTSAVLANPRRPGAWGWTSTTDRRRRSTPDGCTIVEPDLDAAVAGAVARGALTARPRGASRRRLPGRRADAVQGRPPARPDLRRAATRAARAQVLRGGEVVILESTSPPGTTEQMSEWLAEERPTCAFPHEHPEDPDVYVAHCPERVLPGQDHDGAGHQRPRWSAG